jgi:hypothetical protein
MLIVTSSLQSYKILFSKHNENQNRHMGNFVQHTGIFFRKVAHWRYDANTEMYRTEYDVGL